MKNLLLYFIYCICTVPALAKQKGEVFAVEMLPITASEYPFLKAEDIERDGHVLRINLAEDQDKDFAAPILLAPEGVVCVERQPIAVPESVDFDWIFKSFSVPLVDEQNGELLEVSGNFVIRGESFDLFCYCCKRPDNTLVLTAIKIDITVSVGKKKYSVFTMPSLESTLLWRRIDDARVVGILEMVLSENDRTLETEGVPPLIPDRKPEDKK